MTTKSNQQSSVSGCKPPTNFNHFIELLQGVANSTSELELFCRESDPALAHEAQALTLAFLNRRFALEAMLAQNEEVS